MEKNKTVLNAISGITNKFITIFFLIFVRYFFVRNLDNDLLGLEGLFLNVFGVFSILEVGFGTAISFSLFKPIHDNNSRELGAIMKLYKRIYCIIGVIIFFVSFFVAPFIGYIIKNNNIANDKLFLYFMIYSISVVSSYFFANKRTLLFAIKKNYISLNVDTIIKIIVSILQIYVIVKYHNYLLYLFILTIGVIISNIAISIFADLEKAYNKKEKYRLSKEYLNEIKSGIGRIIINNLSWVGINSTDNLIISSTVGSMGLAKNTNYSSISNSLTGIVINMFVGENASVGDLLSGNDSYKKKKYFECFSLIYDLMAGYSAIGFFFISKLFIELWVGSSFLFSEDIIAIISIIIYLKLSFEPLATFQNYSGLYRKYTPFAIMAVLINILFSVVISIKFGIIGVYIGTAITYLFMQCAIILILHRNLFNCLKAFLFRFLNMIIIIISCIAISILDINFDNIFLSLVYKIVTVTIIYWSLILLIFGRSNSFVEIKNYIIKKRGK